MKRTGWRKCCKSTLNIEFEQDWSVGLGATLDDRRIIIVTRIFPGKSDGALLLGFECTINPQNLMKVIAAVFQKMKIFYFFLMGSTLNFGGRSKRKRRRVDICKGILYVEFERYRSLGLCARLRQATNRKCKPIFLASGIFPRKAECHIVGFQMYYKFKKN